jgi:PIN domain nuclease of toxin-antitoxin system
MAFLVDTCAFIWLAASDRRLSRAAVEALTDPDAIVYLSVVSRWEIALKQHRPDFALTEPFDVVMERSTFLPLDLGFAVPGHLASLPWIHKDPFDRLLIAHAIDAGLTLVTRDKDVRKYPVRTLW